MTGPIPSGENYKKRFEKELDNVKDKYYCAPGYKYPVKFDHFNSVKNGSSLQGQVSRKDSSVLDTFGCVKCKWVNSDLCPHKGDVTHKKPHANRICSQRLDIPMRIHDEGIIMSASQMLEVRGYMDADFYEDYVRGEALEKKRDIQDCFLWAKLKADIVSRWRKQDEGTKVSVERKFTPSDLANLIDNAKRVDVVVNDSDDDYLSGDSDDK